jgi:hypothetical protein
MCGGVFFLDAQKKKRLVEQFQREEQCNHRYDVREMGRDRRKYFLTEGVRKQAKSVACMRGCIFDDSMINLGI